MSTLLAEPFGETHTVTEKERQLYTELKALSSRYPVIVNICGRSFVQGTLRSISFDHLVVENLDARVNQDHVTVTLLKQRSSGQLTYKIDSIDIPDNLR